MKKWSVALLIMMIYLSTGGYSRAELSEFQVTSEESNQVRPSIHGSVVLWQDDRDELWHIYGCDLSNQREIHIKVDGRALVDAVTYGNIIVGVGPGGEYGHVYGYDLSTSKGFQITKSESLKLTPAIFGNIVVWKDDRNGNWDIYGYDLSAEKEFCVTRAENDQNDPAIYGDIIVWEDKRNGNRDIYGYDLSTKREFQITEGYDVWDPAIYGNIVVWVDERNFESVNKNWDIYGYDLSTQEEFRITTGISNPLHPAIFGNIVVWSDDRNGNWDIYGYDLFTGKEFQITTDENMQFGPAIYGNVVVWMDLRNGYFDNEYVNWDIYGADFGIDCSGFIRQEGDFFLEKGKKAVEGKKYESALFSFELAKENYARAGAAEKIQECDEWIQTCRTEQEGICSGTFLLLIFVVLGFFVSILRGKKDVSALTAVLFVMTLLSQSTGMVDRDLQVNTTFSTGCYVVDDSSFLGNEVDTFCSVITVSHGGNVLFGGNLDLQLEEISDEEFDVSFFLPHEGYGFVMLSRDWGEKGSTLMHTKYYVGMNEKGLAVAGNGVPFASLTSHPERSFSSSREAFRIKAMRDCSNVASVIELAQDYDFGNGMGGQYHFADSTGDAVVISAGKDGELAFTRKEKGDGYLVSTNFNLAAPESGNYPCWRYDTATEMLGKVGSEHDLTVDYAASILDAIHVEGIRVNTAVSYVFELKNGDIYIYYFHQFKDVVKMNFEEEMTEKNESFQSSDSVFSAPLYFETHNPRGLTFFSRLFPETTLEMARSEIQKYKRQYYLRMAAGIIASVVILSGLSLFGYKKMKNYWKKT